jgi:hypothetical protein
MLTVLTTQDKIGNKPGRLLPLGKGAAGAFCVDTTAPTVSSTPMGRVGVNGVLTAGFRMSGATTPVYLYLWIWHEADKNWWYAGGTSDKYRMTFDVKTGAYDGWYVETGSLYYLTASESLTNVYVGGENKYNAAP